MIFLHFWIVLHLVDRRNIIIVVIVVIIIIVIIITISPPRFWGFVELVDCTEVGRRLAFRLTRIIIIICHDEKNITMRDDGGDDHNDNDGDDGGDDVVDDNAHLPARQEDDTRDGRRDGSRECQNSCASHLVQISAYHL